MKNSCTYLPSGELVPVKRNLNLQSKETGIHSISYLTNWSIKCPSTSY